MIRNQFVLIIVLSAGLLLLPGCQNEMPVKTTPGSITKNLPQNLAADLEKGTIRASGVGLPSTGAGSDAQAKILARRAAITDGQRNLARKLADLQQRAGVSRASGETIVIKEFIIVEEKQLPDGAHSVVLEMKLDKSLLDRLRSN